MSTLPHTIESHVATDAATDAASDTATDTATTWQRSLVWNNSFAQLPAAHYTRLSTTPMRSPHLQSINAAALGLIGLNLEQLQTADAALNFAQAFTGNTPLAGSQPLASVYSGHQFGVWAGQLGDGRAIMLGQVEHAGQRWELQLKGAGKTPYSRFADGRAVLRSTIREYLCAEAMHGLGIPTTRSLCMFGTTDSVQRESTETAAVVTRMAPSFIRFGHFEHWASREQHAQLQELTDYVIDQLYPAARDCVGPHGQTLANPAAALLAHVVHRTATMVSAWQCVGFCHGVMNTDNMSILGLTIDYGPFGFMDGFDANHICNHSDDGGRYAYAMQPGVAQWNLYCLAQALFDLMPYGGEDQVEERKDYTRSIVEQFSPAFADDFDTRLSAKLGLAQSKDEDQKLYAELFSLLHTDRTDFTLFFRTLCDIPAVAAPACKATQALHDLVISRERLDAWLANYRARLRAENSQDAQRSARMKAVNPRIVLRNYLAEQAIARARDHQDMSEVDRLLEALRDPFSDDARFDAYAKAPPHWAQAISVSCSS